MPTPSELEERRGGDWTARSDAPKRSVFGNYGSAEPTTGRVQDNARESAPRPGPEMRIRQNAVETALARSFLHRLLAHAFADPTLESWQWLINSQTVALLRSAAETLTDLSTAGAESWITALKTATFESYLNAYIAAFGHASRGACPLNEIEYGDIKADPLFQPHRLADLAAFYRAFGLEVAEDAAERHDHISIEMEFMSVLAAKEAYALTNELNEPLNVCRDAQRKFLREHLARWIPGFARRLAAATEAPELRALADLLSRFIRCECDRFGINPGSEELLLRPVDAAVDRMCDACGLSQLPPGAVTSDT